MSNIIYGNLPAGTVYRQAGAEVMSEPTGLASTVEAYRGLYSDMVKRAVLTMSDGRQIGRTYLAPHPDFPSLLAYGVRIRRGVGVVNGTLTIEYRGLDPSLSYPPPPIYTIGITTANEPLSTHPLWTTQIAGTPSGPLNGAQFVSYDQSGSNYKPAPSGGNPGTFDPNSGVFYQWLPASAGGISFVGIEDYLAAGAVFKKTYTSYNLPDLSAVGTFSYPDGPAPSLPANYDWFFVGCDAEDNAGLYRNESSWKAVPTSDAARIIYGGS